MQVGIGRRGIGVEAGQPDHGASAGAAIAPGQRAALDPHIRHTDAGGRRVMGDVARGAGGGGRRRRSGLRRELPVRPALGVGLQDDVRLHQHQPLDLDAVAQQRDRRERHVQPLERGHLRARESRRIGETDPVHGQGRPQRPAHSHVALERQVPPRRLLDRRHDARLQAVRIEAEGDDGDAGDHQHEQAKQRPTADAQQPCHRVLYPSCQRRCGGRAGGA